jgi:hypothetical protein
MLPVSLDCPFLIVPLDFSNFFFRPVYPMLPVSILSFLFNPFAFIAPKTLNYLAFDFERHLIKVIQETRRAL